MFFKQISCPIFDAIFVGYFSGSISFISIIIGVITSVKRAAKWPRQQKVVIDVDKKAASTIVCLDNSNNNSGNNCGGGSGGGMVAGAVGKRRNKECEPQLPIGNVAYAERLLNSSADTECIEEEVEQENCVNVIDKNGSNMHLYSMIDRSSGNGSRQLYLEATTNSTHRYNPSSNSTSPLLSSSSPGQGSSHGSDRSGAVLLAPLPPSVLPTSSNNRAIRFADIDSDEC